jgi:hypothetical protein
VFVLQGREVAVPKVVTYQAPNGETLNITSGAEAIMLAAGYWPKNSRGEEFCKVSRGLHFGHADIDATEARRRVTQK